MLGFPCFGTVILSRPLYQPSHQRPQGLSHCFEKNDDGKLQDLMLVEPVNAPAMECMAVGEKAL
jgi:hypothetical protein